MSARRRRVAVLCGGPSREHGVSLESGRAVAEALRGRGLEVVDVRIDSRGLRSLPTAAAGAAALPAKAPDPSRTATLLRLAGDSGEPRVDAVFVALHGAWGEDGTVQGFLETLGLPYTGSGVLASALAMDKERTKEILSHHGLDTPAWVGVGGEAWTREREEVLSRAVALGGPWIVKPAREGSSFGITPVGEEPDLAPALDAALRSPGARALVERQQAGVEVTCPVLGNHGGPLRALPLVEIVPHGGAFFDFHAKYEGGSDEICPARVAEPVAQRVREAALAAHRILGCDGLSRSDFIVAPDGTPWFLETNTVPGMTPASLSPLSAAHADIPFDALCELLVDLAVARHRG